MKIFLRLVAVALASLPALAPAAELTKIDRRLLKEPSYKGKPKYCLLVFGSQAKTRVWLVQDGDALYVDRNGNGDLTETGEKVSAEKRDGADEGEFTFKAGDIRDGVLVHKDLNLYVSKIDHLAEQDDFVQALLAKTPNLRGYYLFCEVAMPGWKGSGVGGRVQHRAFYVDASGVLQFADRPADAPIIHFGGPWQITLFGRQRLMIGRDTDLMLGVGCAGVGPGATSWIDYQDVIPENVHPTVEVTYPPRQPGESPLRERYELKRRC